MAITISLRKSEQNYKKPETGTLSELHSIQTSIIIEISSITK